MKSVLNEYDIKINKLMEVSVGIMETSEVEIRFKGTYTSSYGGILSGVHVFNMQNMNTDQIIFSPESFKDSYFEIADVTIGKDFHWQQQEAQRFRGNLKLIRKGKIIIVINELPVEEYLRSVVSSEMKATAPLEFLKAHAVISRSWVISQIMHKNANKGMSGMIENRQECIKWYDHTQHIDFDVCADDHCQRYQGITKITNSNAIKAVTATAGLILTYDGKICDTRFSKCCGGAFERFDSCWGDETHPYLAEGRDLPHSPHLPDLTNEENAAKWITDYPDALCNTSDRRLLQDSLNGYDRTTTDFYRWKVEYSQDELSDIVRTRSGIDFGDITDLIPLKRGVSGRIIKLRIIGSKRSMTIGKELEIRRILSRSHLYSSAFIVKKEKCENELQNIFVIKGAGWGHGVGLCQIGAAIMASKGYDFREILRHYYPSSTLSAISIK